MTHFFGEWVEFRNEQEKEEAIQYLALWVKFFVRKVPTLELVDQQLIIKSKAGGYPIDTVGCKITMKGEKPDNALTLDEIFW